MCKERESFLTGLACMCSSGHGAERFIGQGSRNHGMPLARIGRREEFRSALEGCPETV
jgi:hypothetical protein